MSILWTTTAVATAQPAYTVTDLGVFPTGTGSRAYGINELGHVAGESDKNETFYPQAVLWADGQMLDLTGLGISGAAANAVNDAGQVVGFSDAIGLNAFSWIDGVLTELPVPLSCCSVAHDVNASGQIVGQASPESIGSYRAVLWEEGVMTDLGTLGGLTSHGHAINDAGQVVGMASAPGGVRAFLWQDDEMEDLGTLGGNDSQANGINELGHVVGYADDADQISTAFIWRSDPMTSLGTLPGGLFSYAYGINDHDHVVGASYGDGFTSIHATIWIDDQPVDLNDLIDPASGWVLTHANEINNAGQIVGRGVKDDQIRAFLLTPTLAIPAVSEWGSVAMGLLVLAVATLSFRRTRAA